ncbi:MAG TPA: hypothetical protein ENK82_07645, partial [Campylobacterales bacterium]|nr:hypothetical protein [Campylobacterales bacterium]
MIKPIFFISISLLFIACSKPNVLAESGTHLYNHNYGIVADPHADALLHREYLSMNQPTEVEMPLITDPEITTELTKDPDAFYA